MLMLVTVNLDEETHAILKEWPNASWQLREYIKELHHGLRPLCLGCGKPLYSIVGTKNLICPKCGATFQLVQKYE